MLKMNQVFSLVTIVLALFTSATYASDIGSVIDSVVRTGNNSGIVLQSPEDLFMSLEKRQQCQAGYGTCPGGVTCGCAVSNNCCGQICKYTSQRCCTGYICDANEYCCSGTLHSEACNPVGTQCCFDGSYCRSGTYCIKYDDENFARCRVIGSVSEPPSRTTYATTAAPIPSSTYIPAQVTTRYYTITYTVYWYYYYYYSFTTYYPPSTFTLSTVRSSYTSTPATLSAYATGSADARNSLSADASAIESSFSSSALSSSMSMSSVCSVESSSFSSRVRLLSTAASTTSSGGSSGGSGSGSGGGVTQNTSTGNSLTFGNCIAMLTLVVFTTATGALMIIL